MSLAGLVLEVHGALRAARLPHAFGGALALAYIADPRATADIDVNVFVPWEDLDRILQGLSPIGLVPEADPADALPAAGLRLRRAGSPFPVDVFPSLDPAYAEAQQRIVRRPFGPDRAQLPFLSAEDLAVFKLSFGRPRDWVDLQAIAQARPDLDADYVEQQLVALRGPHMYPRLARLRSFLREAQSEA